MIDQLYKANYNFENTINLRFWKILTLDLVVFDSNSELISQTLQLFFKESLKLIRFK